MTKKRAREICEESDREFHERLYGKTEDKLAGILLLAAKMEEQKKLLGAKEACGFWDAMGVWGELLKIAKIAEDVYERINDQKALDSFQKGIFCPYCEMPKNSIRCSCEEER